MTHNLPSDHIYVASCVEDGGIYRYFLHDDGKLELAEKAELDRPMYMTVENDKMYIVLRAPFEGRSDSGVIVCDIVDGKLVNFGEITSTKGEVACHIAVDNEKIYCANYISGSVIKLPDILKEHSGHGKNPKRQEKAHAHYVGFTPDKKYLCAVDLGVDTIFVYDKDMNPVSSAKVPEGHGARHIVFSDDGKYMFCAGELESSVSAFEYNDGKFSLIDTICVLPKDFSGESTAAAIRIYKGKIYVSNRGHDSVSQISFENRKLTLEKTIDCKGKSPRDFDFINDFMICTNESSDNVTVFACNDNFKFVCEVSVAKPLCVV